jgi:hypothetical protein
MTPTILRNAQNLRNNGAGGARAPGSGIGRAKVGHWAGTEWAIGRARLGDWAETESGIGGDRIGGSAEGSQVLGGPGC